MGQSFIPAGYAPHLSLYETQSAISLIKRVFQDALSRGKGIYTDMNAIRRDEELDNLHSVYVDQWDWEKVITPEARTPFTLHQAVTGIVSCIYDTQLNLRGKYPQLCETPL